jgi:hypothetical protein
LKTLPARILTRFAGFLLCALVAGIALALIRVNEPARAESLPEQLRPNFQATPGPVDFVPMSDDQCLECHARAEMSLPLPSGEQLSLQVARVEYRISVHGQKGYACIQCHTDRSGFPHPAQAFQDTRDVTIYMSQSCAACHAQPAEDYHMGAHAKRLEEGDKNSATCADCHGSHTIQEFSNSRTRMAAACQQCHAEIYDLYKDSVHGEALLNDFNPDVPACVDCHGNHNVTGPTQDGFHLASPELCAKCHTDEALMARYDVNTDVFDTYFADFHGTTVQLFEKTTPDQETNKPVCIDCHGVHDIKSPEDIESTVLKQNLLSTCQGCHPDATPNFSDAWLSHYKPDLQNHTLVYLVDLFYKVFIPGTLGIMALFVVTDFWRTRLYKPKPSGGAEE